MAAQPKLKLTYFNARGLAEVSRLIFAAAGASYEDFRYPLSEKFERPEFEVDKHKFPYGQVPVLEVDGVQIAQSKAVERYLVRHFKFTGQNDVQAALAEGIAETVGDLRTKHQDAKKGGEEALTKFLNETLPTMLNYLETAAKKHGNGSHAVGNDLTIADFYIYGALSHPGPFDEIKDKLEAAVQKTPTLVSIRNTVSSHPGARTQTSWGWRR